jgi:Fe2+ transport system protein FeoA/predicted transcriptional regulator
LSSNEKIVEILELARTSEIKKRVITPEEMARELKISIAESERLFEEALNKGYLKHEGDKFKLTRKGDQVLQKHRESYIHEKFTHPPGLIGRLARFFEGNIRDWRKHWRHKHGLDERSISNLYRSIRALNGRIEETLPLINLKPGEKGTVAFTLGGRGLVRRLAEMGLTPGTLVKILRSAPFHGPLEIEVRGSTLALGYGVASKVFVKKQTRAN